MSAYRTELLARLRQATDDLGWSVRNLSHLDASFRPAPGEWSVLEHLSHARDMEREVFLPLLRWATVPEMLDPRDYSRREWHERRYNPAESLAEVMDDIQRMRDEELAIFGAMTEQTWTRWRNDTRWGPLTCQWLAETMYRHALDHLQGIMALRADIHLSALQPLPAAAGGFTGGAVR